MLKIEKSYIDEEYENLKCIIEYPVITNLNNNSFIEYINKKIHDDVLIFKEISEEEYMYSRDNTIVFIDFKIHLNKNNIISISIIFSELYNFNKIINYINTYNFDLKRKRELLIEDIFNKTELIENNIGQNFYITNDYVSIVFSSYENKDTCDIDEIKINFKDNESDISNYIKSYIME
ncbi:hypothetical protein QJS64_19010 [Paraclostridium bifermentans]|uniref:Deacetylase PdaC domain-containing protein n=1 Tax=Paraclostridium bifermentans TaxID=1490 RepID=A0ABY8R3Q8_PARBF|nr:hypothetical protein QJS64_19010 [Paraclostridium bifermentans]